MRPKLKKIATMANRCIFQNSSELQTAVSLLLSSSWTVEIDPSSAYGRDFANAVAKA